MLTEGFVVFNDRTKRFQLSKILSDIRKKHVFGGNRVNIHCELHRHNSEIQLTQAGKIFNKNTFFKKTLKNLEHDLLGMFTLSHTNTCAQYL